MTKKKIDGIFILDKPLGISSNKALQIVKKLFNAKKAGHCGSLDLLASGVLPICMGEATKFSNYMLEADKTYIVTAKLGIRTTTCDSEGEVISRLPVPNMTTIEIENVLDKFKGETYQVPSMFSALKHQGQPLYKLARQGIEIKREPRLINIKQLIITDYNVEEDSLTLEVECSKGTYIRNLIDDLGNEIGCGAYVTDLRRTAVGNYSINEAVTIEKLEEAIDANHDLESFMLPVDNSLIDFEKVELTEAATQNIRLGRVVSGENIPTFGYVRLFSHQKKFLGLGEITKDNLIAPKRLISAE